jgi:hypothetical protein
LKTLSLRPNIMAQKLFSFGWRWFGGESQKSF